MNDFIGYYLETFGNKYIIIGYALSHRYYKNPLYLLYYLTREEKVAYDLFNECLNDVYLVRDFDSINLNALNICYGTSNSLSLLKRDYNITSSNNKEAVNVYLLKLKLVTSFIIENFVSFKSELDSSLLTDNYLLQYTYVKDEMKLVDKGIKMKVYKEETSKGYRYVNTAYEDIKSPFYQRKASEKEEMIRYLRIKSQCKIL